MEDVLPIRRALLSVSDKRGLIELAQALAERSVHLLASGGTRTTLLDAGFDVTEVSAYTGQPEILGGRVKTLHPKLHGGILARRDVTEDLAALEAHGIEPIDLVVVNLYPFEATIAKPGVSFEEAVENIDIGGPSLIRGAAKNHNFVAVLTDPDQYTALIDQLRAFDGTTLAYRRDLARAVFDQTAKYDRMIADYLDQTLAGETDRTFPTTLAPDIRSPFHPSLWRESTPARCALCGAEACRSKPGNGADSSWQRAVLQQPARPRQRAQNRSGFRRTIGCDP